MDAYFTDLGRTVYDRWHRADFSLPAFPGIASAALEERPPSAQVDLARLMRAFLLEDEQPFQSSSGFGQPELIVHDNPRFYIQLLFWLDGTTDIHQHGFSGAFHVLEGSSIHCEYGFERVRPVTARFRTGTLRLRRAALLERGTTVPILSGNGCIHSLFHLETPSVTVVIRTHSDPGTDPQFTYLPPRVALDPAQNDPLTLRRKQLLDVLEQTGDPAYAKLVLGMVRTLDLERGFFILQNGIAHLRALGAWDAVWKAFVARHGAKAKPLLPTLEEIIRRDALVALRGGITDADHRFFLALLLNLGERERILRMIGKRYPGSPLKTLCRWAEELVEWSPAGTRLLDAVFPERLKVAEEEQAGLLLEALDHFVAGAPRSAGLRALPQRHLTALRDAFAASSWRPVLRGA